jgi:plastocyanin
MRFNGLALVTGAIAIVACGGGDKSAVDTTQQHDTATAPAAQNTGAMSTTTTTGGTVAMAQITGKTVEVKMSGDGTTFKFDPANVTIKSGDGVKFTVVSSPPHDVAFVNVPPAAKAQLMANMPNQMKELTSPMMMTPNENYTVSFAKVPPGTYSFTCEPHAAMGMKGTITVQ